MERITKGAAKLADELYGNLDDQKKCIEDLAKENGTMKNYIKSLE